MNGARSTFVTVVAWIFIAGSGFATLVSLMQNIMVHIMYRDEVFSRLPDYLPTGAAFVFDNIRLLAFVFLLLCLIMFVASVGLLKRKNLARLVFIVILSLGVLWSLGGIALQAVFFPPMPEMAQDPEAMEFQVMLSIMRWFTVIIGIGVAGLFLWIIRRLLSDPVKHEFRPD